MFHNTKWKLFFRIQEQYRKRQEKQKYEQQQQKNEDRAKEEIFPSTPTRAERIQQLRSEHQRRHRERHGQYPSDTQEELYERKIQQFERQVWALIVCQTVFLVPSTLKRRSYFSSHCVVRVCVTI